MFTCQRFKGSFELLQTFHRGRGSDDRERLKAEKGQKEGNNRWMSYHVVSFLDSPEKVGLAPSLSVIPPGNTVSVRVCE